LIANLLRQVEINPSAVFGCPETGADFEHYLFSTWIALGARRELFEDVPINPVSVTLDREEASSLLCQSIILVAQ
jgi:hypothetical protein